MEKALLVTVVLKPERGRWGVEELAYELEELTAACGVEVVDNIACNCDRATPDLLIGSGKAQEIAAAAEEKQADTVIFSHDLSGTQQRNLEDIIGRKTIDRTQLILDIFARRAHSPEGKTQVELAQLQYLLPRLIGKGIILSRTGGGIGTSGPGETRLEVDRRRIRKRIEKLRDDLSKMSGHRLTRRKKRLDQDIPTVALVGYTNAGKSTLLNALTNAGQVVSDGLFTTLDPLDRVIQLSNGESVIVSDTVGFLHKLPHQLIEAFKATLEQVVEADLLIHVLDASNPRAYECTEAVFEVLRSLGAQDKPIITALNKSDRIQHPGQLQRLLSESINPIAISAREKTNLDLLLAAIAENFKGRVEEHVLLIPHSRLDLIDTLYREGKVKKVHYLQKGAKVSVSLPKIIFRKLQGNRGVEVIS